MLVVSNTSPVLNLAVIGQLELLRQQFHEVLIPQAVLDELRLDANYPGTEQIRQALTNGWLRVVMLENTQVARALQRELDDGEAEAIALALQLKADTILMDERVGRSAAKMMGHVVVGILGILLQAKQDGQVKSVKEILSTLERDAGFYVDARLAKAILSAAGEE